MNLPPMGNHLALYQEMILEHCRNPRHHQRLAPPCHISEGYNPLCGDRCEVFLKVNDDRLAEVCFIGQGCAISRASASMMTEVLRGLSRQQAQELITAFLHFLTTGQEPEPSLGKLVIFSGIHRHPSRVKCASLAWHTLREALSAPVRQASCPGHDSKSPDISP